MRTSNNLVKFFAINELSHFFIIKIGIRLLNFKDFPDFTVKNLKIQIQKSKNPNKNITKFQFRSLFSHNTN